MEIRGKGDKVKISSIGDVTISDYTKSATITPEQLQDASLFLEIEKQKYFAIYMEDVDKAQVNVELMKEGMRKAAIGLANVVDDYIFSQYASAGATVTQAALTSANMFSTLTAGLKALQQNNVPSGSEMILEISPAVYEKILLADIVKNFDNKGIIENGYVGTILGMKIYVSNGISTSGSLSRCLLRTRDAITFAEQINMTEAYRSQTTFNDVVRGLQTYGCKVVRPKELVLLALTPAAETTI